ncbi:TPA: DUF6287 domain-containing protein [Streptococcus suis]
MKRWIYLASCVALVPVLVACTDDKVTKPVSSSEEQALVQSSTLTSKSEPSSPNSSTEVTSSETSGHSSTGVTSSETSRYSSTEVTSSETSGYSSTSVSSPVAEKVEEVDAGMSLEAISNGDFSSIAGTWSNAQGQTMTFDDQGLVEGGIVSNVNVSPVSGLTMIGVGSSDGIGGFLITLIPAGQVAPNGIDELPDNSDATKDRMIAGHQYVVSDPDLIFYRVREED